MAHLPMCDRRQRDSRQKFFAPRLFYFSVHRSRKKLQNPSMMGPAHFRGLASEQHSSEEPWQRWRVVGHTLFNSTGAGIAPLISSTDTVSPLR